MKQIIIIVVAVVLGCVAYFGIMNYFIVYLPDQAEISDGYRYKYITEWMEGEDAHHFLPTINKAMDDGVMQEFEYKKLREIEDSLILSREKAKFEIRYKEYVDD